MARLKNHSAAYWLRDDSAAAFNRMEDERGFIDLNSAGRTVAEQNELIRRWDQGGTYNRPPYLYAPARPATASNHVAGGGKAFDTSEWRRVKEFAHLYGFRWFGSSDPVHFDYVGGGSSSASGNQVTKDRQNWLNVARGAGLVVDGIEGPATKQAYKNYQSFLGITADGVWGPQTQAAHQRYYDSRNAPAASSSSSILEVQKKLKANYPLYAGKLVLDGIQGPATTAAIKEFQRRSGLMQDGIAGPITRRALGL